MAVPLPGIEHIVVLMLENRSFDNVLGGLYPELTRKGLYRGLWGNETNPLDPTKQGGSSVPVFQGAAAKSTWTMPYPDPGEEYTDMVQQIFGAYSVPSGRSCSPAMTGFAWNYSRQPWSPSGPGWPSMQPIAKNIMQYYSAAALPVTYFLAKQFAACDWWFAAAPVQTIANRVLAHCGTPGKVLRTNRSRVNNYPDYNNDLGDPIFVNDKTIFNLLDTKFPPPKDGPVNWTVYYGGPAPISLICWYVVSNGNYFPYQNFAADLKKGKLAKYVFIEPRYSTSNNTQFPVNSNHPGGAVLATPNPNDASLPPPVDVRDGERLLCDVYETLRGHPDLFKKTLLIVTYDEHGGLFDHEPPPCAQSPFDPPADNFNYDRYGVRVPTLLINPYIKPGTVYPERKAPGPMPSPPFDHTSLIHTVIDQFELGNDYLTKRVESAPAIKGIISQTYTPPPPCPAVPSPEPSPAAVAPPPPPVSAPPGKRSSLGGLLNALSRMMESGRLPGSLDPK